ncbi:AAA family ATPase [Maribellus luteus]|uniref:AAA family ATPase n=1 Tax=Maribellus luteus TaxID=2305463 RepID=A0A399SSN4_9BACT|nr:AAA family ATPase [Maribellus luteus]RIJ45502.1 AAA family ATPase [Maribellus luteus]
MEIRKAQRKQAKIKLALQGPSGSGKTYSALLLAAGLTNYSKIAVIDTENHSADLYAHLGDFNVLQLSKPFTPERYITAIETCEEAGMEVIIIDSVSHEWEGSGGILDLHGNMPGNSFTNWAKMTPRHNAFVQKILESPCHVISTIRTKTDYTLSEKNGKMIPEKVGLKGITRDGMDYEFTIVFDLDIKHNATASKDRTGLFMDKPAYVISSKTGERILNWCNQGTSLDEVIKQVQQAKDVVELRDLLKKYPEYRSKIEPLAVKRKEALNAEIINATKIGTNGTGKSK